jgi:rhamnosyltransferase subunit B
MSSRILLSTFGSFGDIHPFIALAHELKSRGHTPVIATSELYRAKIEAEGIAFHAARPDWPAPAESHEFIRQLTSGTRGLQFLYRGVLMPALRDAFADLESAAREADLVVSHVITPAAPLAAQVAGKKWMSVALAPISLWSVYDPPFLVGAPLRESLYRMPTAFHRSNLKLGLRWMRSWTREVEIFRAELGLPRAGHPLREGGHSPHGTLALFSRVLAAPQPDWPAHVTVCGYCFYDNKGAASGFEESSAANSAENGIPELSAFLAAGEKPIVFTLGSSAVFDARDFYEQSAQAARLTKRRALLLIGEEANRPRGLPRNTDHIAAFNYAPYGAVFERAAAVVHSGGAGTCGQVLRAGVPSLIVPIANDQPDHAMRLQRIGVGRVVTRGKYAARRGARELDTLLRKEKYARRAMEIALQVRAENGPRAAADAIEAVLL